MTRVRRRIVEVVGLMTPIVLADVAFAQQSAAPASSASPAPSSGSPAPGASPEAANSVRTAQEHTARALQFFRANDFRNALHEFELANDAAPSADFLYNIARCHEALNDFDDAARFYQQYLRDKVDPPDRADVERHIADLHRRAEQTRVASHNQDRPVEFHLTNVPAGTQVFLGTRLLGRAPLPDAIAIPEGNYPLRAVAPGMQDWEGQLHVRRGYPARAYISMTPEARYETRSGGHLVSYILAGLTAVALGTGIYFGVTAAGDMACNGNDPCARRDNATRADVMFGVTAGLALTTAIVYFVEAASFRTERVQTPVAAHH